MRSHQVSKIIDISYLIITAVLLYIFLWLKDGIESHPPMDPMSDGQAGIGIAMFVIWIQIIRIVMIGIALPFLVSLFFIKRYRSKRTIITLIILAGVIVFSLSTQL